MKSILKKGAICFFIVLSVYLICNIVRIRNRRQHFLIPHTNIELTFYGDYIILGEKYTSILPPKSNYLKIKKYNNLFCKFVFLSDNFSSFFIRDGISSGSCANTTKFIPSNHLNAEVSLWFTVEITIQGVFVRTANISP